MPSTGRNSIPIDIIMVSCSENRICRLQSLGQRLEWNQIWSFTAIFNSSGKITWPQLSTTRNIQKLLFHSKSFQKWASTPTFISIGFSEALKCYFGIRTSLNLLECNHNHLFPIFKLKNLISISYHRSWTLSTNGYK